MPPRRRPADEGSARGRAITSALIQEARRAREDRGLTQEDVARALGLSRSRFCRIEGGGVRDVSIERLSSWFAVVGLELSARAFPGGRPIRDEAHRALLERLRARLHPSLVWRTEVPMPLPGDRRAWDAAIIGREWTVAVEAETRPTDGQALERRIALKQRDSRIDHVLLLLADTRHNRAVVSETATMLATSFPGNRRHVLDRLRQGGDPGTSAIVLL